MARKDIFATDYSKSTLLSPIEAQILSQYQLLGAQLNILSDEIKQLNSTTNSSNPQGKSSSSDDNSTSGTADKLLDNLRNLEMKIGLVYTLFKGAVYSLFLQYEEDQNLKNDEEQRRQDDSEDDADHADDADDANGENREVAKSGESGNGRENDLDS